MTEVRLHVLAVDAPGSDADAGLLDAAERARAARFVTPGTARRFVAARAFLRRVLGAATGLDPASLRFAENEHGKPSLAGEAAATGVRFNLSHSHGVAVVATARGVELGVDVEQEADRHHPVEDLARRYFADEEVDRVRAAAEGPERRLAFLRVWTGKEAYLKALGVGITRDLGSFAVRPGADPSRAVHDPRHPVPMHLEWPAPPAGCVLALAVATRGPVAVRRVQAD